MKLVSWFILLIIPMFCVGQSDLWEKLKTPEQLEANNGILTVKFDLTRGGAISWISLSGTDKNLVNIADEGRYIQQSYYAGKSIDRKSDGQSPSWTPWAWNPIQVGDAFGNRAKILDFKQSKDSLYVKCIPMRFM